MVVTSGLKQLLEKHTQALEQDPDNPKLRVEVAEVLESMELPADALAQYETASRLFVNLGLYREAAATCKRVLNLDPSHKEARRILQGMQRRGLVDADEPASTPDPAPGPIAAEAPGPILPVADPPMPVPDPPMPAPIAEVVPDPALEASPPIPEENTASALQPSVSDDGVLTSAEESVPEAAPLSDPLEEESVPDASPLTTPPEGEPVAPVATKELVSLSSPGMRTSGGEQSTLAGVGLLPLLPPEVATSGLQQSFEAGETIVDQDEESEQLFLIVEGRAQATRTADDGSVVGVGELEEGSFFGELALLGDGRSHVTVQAVEPCTVQIIPKSHFRRLMRGSGDADRLVRTVYRDRLKAMALRSSPLFRPLHDRVARRFLRQFRPVKHDPGASVLREGDAPNGLYLVMLGELQASLSNGEGSALDVASLTAGDFFGTTSLIRNRPCAATVVASSFVQLMTLDAESFHRFNDRHPRFKAMLDAEVKRREAVLQQLLP